MDTTSTAPDDTGETPATCPMAAFRRLREQGPVTEFPGLGGSPARLVTRQEDVRAMLTDPRLRNDASTVDGAENGLSSLFDTMGVPPDLAFLRGSLLARDGDDHTRLRKLVSRAFTVRRVNALRPRVETLTEGLLDGIAAAGAGGRPVDLVGTFAYPLPIAVICELVGVPEPDRPRWRELATLFTAPDPDRMPGIARAVLDQVRALIELRRAEPTDDLVSGLVAVHTEDDDRLSEEEILTLVFDLVTAGFETTAHLLSKSVSALLSRPEQLAVLRAEPELWPQAVHELVRTCGPIPTSLPRYAAADVEIAGTVFPQGSTVMAGLVSANFDPESFAHAEELDVRRETGRGEGHVGFGQGPHYCLGAALARQETEVGLRALVERFGGLRLAEPADGPSTLGFERLPELLVRVD